ncbi:hypothetical protein RDABS01_007220 [Bienertia sinuspersici]
MNDGEVEQICENICFHKGAWPFKYLGTPICNKRISKGDCDQLVHKMTTRIRGWKTKHISFSGTLQLVNTMLMSICTYWMQIMVLPTSVIKEINSICRRFLWEEHIHGSRPRYVSREQACKLKSKGGLGIRDLQLWNQLAMGKLVCQIEEKDSLQVKWVHNILHKESSMVGI